MSKNIIMQQKTADGYEDLYPKADGDSSVIVNNTTNQFLGGGSTVGDALEYLSKYGMYWWKKVYQKPSYGVKSNSGTVGKHLLNKNIYYINLHFNNLNLLAQLFVSKSSIPNKVNSFVCYSTIKNVFNRTST